MALSGPVLVCVPCEPSVADPVSVVAAPVAVPVVVADPAPVVLDAAPEDDDEAEPLLAVLVFDSEADEDLDDPDPDPDPDPLISNTYVAFPDSLIVESMLAQLALPSVPSDTQS